MRHHTFMRRSFTLLASAMAAAASGQVLAETAGKVSFVTGNVTATTPDGQSRALRRGDAINGGDRIETRGGRLQIRFTDGGFVALQPNTVFGVDQYLYANKAPEDSSLFFSLLRGGMRTITGAIGKVNKQSYKVRTPVATIGIRGTGYRATTDNNRTLVSVGHGFVNVENALGNITAGAGQNILATNDVPPGLSREGAEIPATNPEGDNEQTQDEGSGDTPRFGEQTEPDGDSLLASFDPALGRYVANTDYVTPVVFADTDLLTGQPLYSFATAAMSSAQTSLAATFDATRQGGVLTLGDSSTNPVTPLFDSGTLQFNGVTTNRYVGWGEFTNGTVTTNSLSNTSTLGNTQYEAYVVGVTPSPDVIPPAGVARYSLLGGTTPRLNLSTGGTLDVFKIDVDFVYSSIDVRLDLTMSGETFMAKGSDIPIGAGSTQNFSLSGLYTTSSGSSCFSFCSTSINGFFAGADGSQIGAAYNMTTGLGTISGTAGLALDSVAGYVAGSLAAPVYSDGPSFLHLNSQATFGSNGGLLSLIDAYGYTKFSSGSLHFNGVSKNGGLTWGEFTDGAADVDYLGSGLMASATQFEPYIFGTQSTTLLGHGKATYSLQGHSTPRLNQSTAATLNNFSITVDFDLALMDLALGLTAGGKTANVSGTGMDVSDIFLDGAFFLSTGTGSPGGLSVSGSACASFCTADIAGFFSGTGGAQIGAAYAVGIDNGMIKGVAALGLGTPSSASVLPDDQLYTMASTGGSSPLLGGYNYNDPLSTALLADFNANGELVTADSVYPLTQTRLGKLTASVADAGTYKTLSWGRFVNGDVTIDGATVALSGPDSVHYAIGQETPGAMMSNLMYYGGTATYNLTGHTTPTSTNGTGTGLSGQLSVNFGGGSIGVNMDVLMPAATYSVNGNMSFSGSQFNGTGLSTTASSAGVCTSGCSTDISGFFSGQQAQQIGLIYKISDFGGDTIKGAAAFSRGDITPPPI